MKMKKTAVGLLTLFVASMFTVMFNAVPLARATYTLTVVSDTDTMWWDGVALQWQSAVACWIHPSWPTITGATWIWRTQYTDPASEYANVPHHEDGDYWTFLRTFTIPEDAYGFSGLLTTITADNAYAIYINGAYIGGDGALSKNGPDYLEWSSVETYYDFTLQPGENEIKIYAVNFFSSGTYSSNPAGLIYKLVVSYEMPIEVPIDIKPESDPNSICLNDQGSLPVAILGTEDFDVTTIDPETILLGGVDLAERGSPKRPKLAYSFEDASGPGGMPDGYLDLMAFFSVPELITAGALTEDTTALTLDAYLYPEHGGTPITGTDSVRVVPP